MAYIHKKLLQGLLLACVIAVICFAAFFYFRNPYGIYTYNQIRHEKPLLELFAADKYWLTANPDYSPEYMLKYKAHTTNLSSVGRLKIDVLEEANKFVGFVAYHLKDNEPHVGKVLFLAVGKEFRGKKYGEKLLQHAISELYKMGAKTIGLATRVENYSAQNLYWRAGFVQTSSDGVFLQFEYIPGSTCSESTLSPTSCRMRSAYS